MRYKPLEKHQISLFYRVFRDYCDILIHNCNWCISASHCGKENSYIDNKRTTKKSPELIQPLFRLTIQCAIVYEDHVVVNLVVSQEIHRKDVLVISVTFRKERLKTA